MIKDLIGWLYAKCRTVDYGEVTVTLKIHNGEIRHVEKLVKTTERPEPTKVGKIDDAMPRT